MSWQYIIKKDEYGYYLCEAYDMDGDIATTEALSDHYDSPQELLDDLKLQIADVKRQLKSNNPPLE